MCVPKTLSNVHFQSSSAAVQIGPAVPTPALLKEQVACAKAVVC